jgi:uncharacterized RDD family membrane protein YckC
MLTYYVENDRQIGPLDEVSFERLVSQGTITPSTIVWNDRMTDWLPYAEAKKAGFFDGPAAPPSATGETATCLFSGTSFPVSEMFPYGNGHVANQHRDAFYAQIARSGPGGGAEPGTLPYAGFWIRALAFFVDGMILYAINFVVQSALMTDLPPINSMEDLMQVLGPMMAMSMVNIVIGIAYITFFLGKFGATPGKMAFGLVVVTSGGDTITYGRAAARACAELLSAFILYIGYLIAAFDEPERRTLHDRLCDTRVIHRRPTS